MQGIVSNVGGASSSDGGSVSPGLEVNGVARAGDDDNGSATQTGKEGMTTTLGMTDSRLIRTHQSFMLGG